MFKISYLIVVLYLKFLKQRLEGQISKFLVFKINFVKSFMFKKLMPAGLAWLSTQHTSHCSFSEIETN